MVVGIIGMGYVGSALKEGFKKYHKIETFDIQSSLSTCKTEEDLVSKADIIFLCLPTPMKKSGVCDISIVEGTISKLDKIIDIKSEKIIVIKSTTGQHEYQSSDVSGIKGGLLMCETRQQNQPSDKPVTRKYRTRNNRKEDSARPAEE